MSPWVFVLILVFALFLIIMAVISVRDFYTWYREGREFARERKRAKELRRQRKLEKQVMPALKERPAEPSKPHGYLLKPPDQAMPALKERPPEPPKANGHPPKPSDRPDHHGH